jgi:hypothetical protein
LYTAEKKLGEYLTTYANQDAFEKVQNAKAETNLAALGPEIIDAAVRNGYDADAVIKGAKRAVLANLYDDYFDALNKGKMRELERVSYGIIRVNGALKSIEKSMELRLERANKAITEPQKEMMREAYTRAGGQR